VATDDIVFSMQINAFTRYAHSLPTLPEPGTSGAFGDSIDNTFGRTIFGMFGIKTTDNC
jgi:hypothetical protein